MNIHLTRVFKHMLCMETYLATIFIYIYQIRYLIRGSSNFMGKEDSLRDEINPSSYGDRITVLCIDGGGIRGIIPGTILSFLESKLQVCN